MSANIHPFPARMAPELALQTIQDLPRPGVVLDPMAGSGMVLRQANNLGFKAIGFDMDPLAVLMSRAWTTPVEDCLIEEIYQNVLAIARNVDPKLISLPWIDEDKETLEFIDFWFGKKQILDLRKIAYAIYKLESDAIATNEKSALDIVKIGLSRIIVTKEQCASLARDTSHSRPHKVSLDSDYSVFDGLNKSMSIIRKRLIDHPPQGGSEVLLGDARTIALPDNSVTCVLTSPPYLNAIDYMRGHRMSLVWLGYSLKVLRKIRSDSIGAERAPDLTDIKEEMVASFGDLNPLPKRYLAMIDRYAIDILKMIGEVKRVLAPDGVATFVVGNSCLKGVFVRNASAVAKAAEMCGMTHVRTYERDLPNQSRYLPTNVGSALNNRMRTETILSFSV
ncbi:hypothetical protein [Chromobacterium violaceum]|uniref:hypothetical protein n=1 Tax=Chromobacterium violaceum TaxID=536 RepID=UPI003DA92971